MILGLRGCIVDSNITEYNGLPVSVLNLEVAGFEPFDDIATGILDEQENVEAKLEFFCLTVVDTTGSFNGVEDFFSLNSLMKRVQEYMGAPCTEDIPFYTVTNSIQVTKLIVKDNCVEHKFCRLNSEGKEVKQVEPENLATEQYRELMYALKVGAGISPECIDEFSPSVDIEDIQVRNWMDIINSGDSISRVSNMVELRSLIYSVINSGVWVRKVNPSEFLYKPDLGILRFFYLCGHIMPNMFVGVGLYDRGMYYVILDLPKDWGILRYDYQSNSKIQTDVNIGEFYLVVYETDAETDPEVVSKFLKTKTITLTSLRGDSIKGSVMHSFMKAVNCYMHSGNKLGVDKFLPENKWRL